MISFLILEHPEKKFDFGAKKRRQFDQSQCKKKTKGGGKAAVIDITVFAPPRCSTIPAIMG
jgi:hypothetical protein